MIRQLGEALGRHARVLLCLAVWMVGIAMASSAWGPDAVAAPVETSAPAAAEVDAVEPEPESPWTFGLISSMAALSLGGVSAVLGIWIGRDPTRPVVFAGAMTGLIVAAISVGGLQAYLDSVESIERRADLDRMLGMVEEIAAESGDPKLAEIASTQRAKRGKRR
jgi:hypothetical protein